MKLRAAAVLLDAATSYVRKIAEDRKRPVEDRYYPPHIHAKYCSDLFRQDETRRWLVDERELRERIAARRSALFDSTELEQAKHDLRTKFGLRV